MPEEQEEPTVPEPAPEELQESEEDMAALGASEFRANGTDYTINDPNNADEFSASVAYSAGQYVYYQGILYRFTADHAAGAWNSAHVTQAKLGQDVSDLKSALSGSVDRIIDTDLLINSGLFEANAKTDIFVNKNMLLGKAAYNNGIIVDSETLDMTPLMFVEPSTTYIFSFDNGAIAEPSRATFYDANFTVISSTYTFGTESQTGLSLKTVDVPAGAKYMCVMFLKSANYTYSRIRIQKTYSATVPPYTFKANIKVQGYAEQTIFEEFNGAKNAYIIGRIENDLYKDSSMWEIGAIGITNSGWNYVPGYNSRIRLKKGNFIFLRKGDKVKLTNYSNAKFYIGYRYNGSYYTPTSWVTSGEYMIPHDGEWNLSIARLSDSSTVENVSDLLDLLVITRTIFVDKTISSAFPPSAWHNKGISASIGTKADNNKRLCTINFFDPDGMPVTFLAKDGYTIYVCAYTKAGVYEGYAKPDGTFTKDAGQVVTMTEYSIPATDAALYKYYIILNRDDGGNITAGESGNLCISISNLADVVGGVSSKSEAYFNVKNFGAVGNGTTDDAEAIQSAFDACNTAGGGTVYFPAGTYRVNTQIIFYSNTKINMSEGATILRGAEINGIFYSHCTDNTLAYNGVHDVIFEGGTIDLGTGIEQGGLGIGLIHANDVTIRNVTFKHVNVGYHSIDCCCSKNVTIENCIIADLLTTSEWAECIQIDAADQRTSFPSPELSSGAATFDSTPTINVNISGCRFDLNGYSPALGNHNDIESKRIFFHDNVIIGQGGSRGVIAFDHYSGYYNNPNATTEVLIHHNIFDSCSYGFKFDVDATGHFYIRDNIFKNIGTLKVNPTATAGEFLNNIEL